jgi:hypothetical protein
VGDPESPNGVGWSTRFAKLSNQQWENTVTDLFRLAQPTGYSADFVQEPLDKSYVSEAASEQTVSGDAWSRYQTAAEKVAQYIVSDPARMQAILPQGSFDSNQARARAFIREFGRRAYRRPLTAAEEQAYARLFEQGPELVGGDGMTAGVRLVIEAMLQSPHFLYRVESSEAPADSSEPKVFLSGYEIATRLSYALWNSMPSDELLDAAERGELDTAAGVASWAGRMLDDPRAREVLISFHEQTFGVAAYGTQDKDPSLGFDVAALASVLREEARRFFEKVIVQDRGGVAELLTDSVVFVNEATAPYYGLSGITGSELRPVQLDPSERAGFLTQLGFLTKNATRTTSDPIHRGLLVARKVLCDEPDPPPMAFDLPTFEPGLTTREVYEKATLPCGRGCHDTLINPPGFAFENFDAIGRVRSTDQGKPVDTTGTLFIRVGYTSKEKLSNPVTELPFDGAVDMVNKLASEERVHECYARNWMHFVLGRPVDRVERGAGELLRESSMSKSSARDILIALVQLDAFRSRVSE